MLQRLDPKSTTIEHPLATILQITQLLITSINNRIVDDMICCILEGCVQCIEERQLYEKKQTAKCNSHSNGLDNDHSFFSNCNTISYVILLTSHDWDFHNLCNSHRLKYR